MHGALLLALLVVGAGPPAEEIDQTPSACPETGSVVAVFTRKREIWLCRDGVATARYPIALGRGGTGKRRTGDHRTPTGIYSLGTPRPSRLYGTFIPIDYPTPEQARNGHSGGALGIHGPPRRPGDPDFPSTTYDWTDGCVATGTDADAEAVADFVRRYEPTVLLR
jgi:murein L,D-transpeptidase YafK